MTLPKLALGIVVAVALGACNRGGERAIISSSAATTTAVATTEATTTIVPPTTEAGPGTSSTTLRPPAAPSSTVPRPATTRHPAPTTTTIVTPPQCSGVQLTVDVVTDKATYGPGEVVSALATLRNRSGAPCLYSGYYGSSRFRGPSGSRSGTRVGSSAARFRSAPPPSSPARR